MEVVPAALCLHLVGPIARQIFARAGVKVTLACRSRLLPEAEPGISATLTGYFEDAGITVVSGITYRAIRKTESGIELAVAREGESITLEADRTLIATGRTPNIEGLGLTEHGIAVSPEAAIVVDERIRTTRPGI